MLSGKCALVTGSMGGIGGATARKLASLGCNVVLHGLAPAEEGEARRAEVEREFGVRAVFSGADLSSRDGVAALASTTEQALGPVDILVNNAVARHAGPIDAMPDEAWDLAVAVNLTAPFLLIRHVLPGMRRKGWGRIVNLASNWGLTGTRDRGDYVATKHGLVGLTKAVALENLEHGITCNAVAPGATRTPNAERQLDRLATGSGKDRQTVEAEFLQTRQPSGRFVRPEDVAELIAFLCSDAAREMTGSPVSIDGGWLAV